MSDDDHPSEACYDTGSGRWFVLARSGTEWSLMAGPYQTEGGMKRVRCEGTWRDAVTHAEWAIAEIRRQMGTG